MRGIFSLLCSISLLLAAGCSARQQSQAPLSPEDAPGQGADAIAFFVGSSAQGASTSLNEGGETVIVTVGEQYFSALNTACKKAELRSAQGMRHIAVCLDNGEWRVAPDIFSAQGRDLP